MSYLPNAEILRARRNGALRLIGVLSVAAALVFLLFCGAAMSGLHRDARASAEAAMVNLAHVTSQSIAQSFSFYDLALQNVIIGLHDPTLRSLSPRARRIALYGRVADETQIDRIFVLDKDGNTIDDSAGDGAHETLAETDYFQAQKDPESSGLFVSRPFHSKWDSGDLVVALSRHAANVDANGDGVVVAFLNLGYFGSLFDSMQAGRNDVFAVLRDDGIMIARSPFQMTAVGKSLAATPIFKQISSKASGGVDDNSIGGGRLFGFARVETLPLIVVVGAEKARLFVQWRGRTEFIAALSLFLAGALALLGFLLSRELRLRLEAEQNLRIAASTDSLTGVHNRRFFDDIAAREWKRAMREGAPLSFLIIDVDHFKQYNDKHGHLQGDEALKAVAACIKERLERPADLIGRYGGEEFAVLLPDTDLVGARYVAEDARQAVMKLSIHCSQGSLSALTVCIGLVSVRPTAGDLFSEAFAAADRALYEAKETGRNRVAVAAPPASVVSSVAEEEPQPVG